MLAVGVRLLYAYSTPPESPIGSTDAWGYHRLARNLDRGNGFSLRRHAPFVPDSIRTPLYPAFLLLVRRTLGPSPRNAVVVQVLLDGITTLGAYGLAKSTSGALGHAPGTNRRVGAIAALFYALDPSQVRYTNELLTETLLSLLLTWCLCTFVQSIRPETGASPDEASGCARRSPRYSSSPDEASGTQSKRPVRRVLLLGFLAGLSALCKPNVQFLPVIWFPCILLAQRREPDKRTQRGVQAPRIGMPPRIGMRPLTRPPFRWAPFRWREAGFFVLAFLAVLAPWVVRNALVFGRPFLSTAFEGNVSRVSAPATLIAARDQYAAPWSAEWEGAFGEIVSQAARRYAWSKPWETLSGRPMVGRELDVANRQVYRVAREVLRQHPLAWLESHVLGLLRYLEPQTYRILHARFTGHPWPPDILQDAILHTIRQVARGHWSTVGQIIGQERWAKLTPFQRSLWWSMFLARILGLVLVLRGAWALRTRPALATMLLGTLVYVLWLPGPIAYERFCIPVWSLIATLLAIGGASECGASECGASECDPKRPPYVSS